MHEIGHVSDTALMVAAARARETGREDGLVRDPLAERLAGERGMAILNGIERIGMLSFGVGMRCRFMEGMLADLVKEDRIARVLSLGAGLDTRPYRLDLPGDLEWVEVDFPEMIEYKAGVLQGEPARCRLERVAADLEDAKARGCVFDGADSRTLVITEGLLMYLSGELVRKLVEEGSRAGYWLVEMVSAEFQRRIGMGTDRAIEAVRHSDCVDGEAQKGMFGAAGWKVRARKNYTSDVWAAAPARVMELMQARTAAGIQSAGPPDPNDMSGVYLWER